MLVESGSCTLCPADLGAAREPRNGLPPPITHSLALQITAEAGTLIPLGRFARCVHVSAAMSYSYNVFRFVLLRLRPPATYMCPLMIPNPGPPIVIGMLMRLVLNVLATGSYSHTCPKEGSTLPVLYPPTR